jgi:hypothetical protein
MREAGCRRVCTQEWTQSAFWNPKGIQVEAPVLQNMPRLPAPLGTLVYTKCVISFERQSDCPMYQHAQKAST